MYWLFPWHRGIHSYWKTANCHSSDFWSCTKCITHMHIAEPYQQRRVVCTGFWWSRRSQGKWPISQHVLLSCTSYGVIICNKSGCYLHDLQRHNHQVLWRSMYVVIPMGFFEQSLTVLGKSELKYLFCCRTKKCLSELVLGFVTLLFPCLLCSAPVNCSAFMYVWSAFLAGGSPVCQKLSV